MESISSIEARHPEIAERLRRMFRAMEIWKDRMASGEFLPLDEFK